MKIGLLSDTHGFLDPKVAGYFAGCDEIWHAGDIGEMAVIEALERLGPVRAVHGNIDDGAMRARFPEDLWFDCGGLSIWITHIGGSPPNFNPRVLKLLKEKKPDIFVCGHSHILRIVRDSDLHLLYLNPGAAGNHGFHTISTIVRFEIAGGKIKNMEAIELGKRGQIRS